LRRMVILRKGFWIFSANIIVTMLIAKWIQFPATFFAFFTLTTWSLWMGLVARLSELTGVILLVTSNRFSQKKLGIWWKRIQRSSYIYFYTGPIIALQYADHVWEYYIPMILLPILWFTARFWVKLWK
jgi:DMSO/TMAO reductase YedYZ heme-binding membrane subunit